MKKFEFSLEKLLDIKEQMTDKEKQRLADLRREKEALIAELEAIQQQLEKKSVGLQNMLQEGAMAIEIAHEKRFISIKQQEMKFKQKEIDKKEDEIQLQLQVVLNLNREVETILRLKESQYEEYLETQRKEQELFIEEFVRNTKARQEHIGNE